MANITLSDPRSTHNPLQILSSLADMFNAAVYESAIISITDPRGIITYVNDQFCLISSYSADEVIGKHHRIIKSGYHSTSFYKNIWEVISTGQIWRGEICNRAQTDNLYWLHTTIIPFLTEEEIPYQYISIGFDITSHKERHQALEMKLQKKLSELEKKNAELEELAQVRENLLILREDMTRIIVHDLRNPLTAVGLSTQIVQKILSGSGKLNNQKRETINKKLKQIVKLTQDLHRMTESLLLTAKLESGKLILNPAPVNLQELGLAIIENFDILARFQKIKLEGDLLHSDRWVLIDVNIFEHIISNLISNAIKFSSPRKRVVLEIKCLSQDQDSEKMIEELNPSARINKIRVRVLDEGCGISDAKKAVIFQKFEVGDLKKGVVQIGLGLAFCKMAVEAQGGTITAEDNDPNGSIFTVDIPVIETTKTLS